MINGEVALALYIPTEFEGYIGVTLSVSLSPYLLNILSNVNLLNRA